MAQLPGSVVRGVFLPVRRDVYPPTESHKNHIIIQAAIYFRVIGKCFKLGCVFQRPSRTGYQVILIRRELFLIPNYRLQITDSVVRLYIELEAEERMSYYRDFDLQFSCYSCNAHIPGSMVPHQMCSLKIIPCKHIIFLTS